MDPNTSSNDKKEGYGCTLEGWWFSFKVTEEEDEVPIAVPLSCF